MRGTEQIVLTEQRHTTVEGLADWLGTAMQRQARPPTSTAAWSGRSSSSSTARSSTPQILSAYDAVSQWMTKAEVTMGGRPREIYFTDFGAAGPADEVCDVAFPVAESA